MTLDFHTLTIADREAYQAVSLRSGRRNCNFTFANLVGWQFWFRTEVCILPDAVVLRFPLDGERAYMLCCAGTPCCDLLQAICDDCGGRMTLLGLEDDQMDCVNALMRECGSADASATNAITQSHINTIKQRNQYDYIYRRADLASLAGGKLKAKRNHVNKFLSEYPDFEYRPLEPSMFDECRRLEILWREERGDVNPVYDAGNTTEGSEPCIIDTILAEQRVMETVFAHWDALGMTGGSIWLDGRMVAFTYGAAVTDDTIDVCVEKADRTIDGLFSVINQQFCAHLPEQYVYVNREEDMGLEGLRKAKLSYHPEILLTYNDVHIA